MCSKWRLIYNAWNLVLVIDLLQCGSKETTIKEPTPTLGSFLQSRNFLATIKNRPPQGSCYNQEPSYNQQLARKRTFHPRRAALTSKGTITSPAEASKRLGHCFSGPGWPK